MRFRSESCSWTWVFLVTGFGRSESCSWSWSKSSEFSDSRPESKDGGHHTGNGFLVCVCVCLCVCVFVSGLCLCVCVSASVIPVETEGREGGKDCRE